MKAMNGERQRVRRNFGKIGKTIDIPNLIEVQKHSYSRFLQKDEPPEERKDYGLQSPFKSVFPIQDFSGTSSLEFVKYTFEAEKYDEDECISKGMTYEAPLRLTARLLVFDTDAENATKSIRDIKEQEIYFGTIPMMTKKGTFIINGTERVIVSQLHRSPGVFFDHDKGKTHSSGKLLYSARIIPLRGSWLDFEFDQKDLLHVRIDRRRKFPATTFLKALGYSSKELLSKFYDIEKISISKTGLFREAKIENLYRQRISRDIHAPKGKKKKLAKKGDKYTKRLHRELESMGIDKIPVNMEDVEGRILIDDLIDESTGEVLGTRNQPLTQEIIERSIERGITEIECLVLDAPGVNSTIRDTMLLDKIDSSDEAKLEIYRKMRPSSPPTQEVANSFFNNLFFNVSSFDLSSVGRLKLNYRLDLKDVPLDLRTLRKEDIILIVKELIRLKNSEASVDDIDNLGNRRVRAVGELLENQYRIGLVRMERAIKERMSLQEVETLMPHDLINSKPVSAVVKEFFGTSQLSQFMDQTNPLSEVTHKRRLSALGPGGLTRDRAGFEVRDVHPTHYGRICPIETPEGPNIGLIVSLSTFARVNEYGFIETPYRHVTNGKVTKNISYLSALNERDYPIAQANAPLDSKGMFINKEAAVRIEGEASKISTKDVVYMDVSPDQLVSVSASLIPFLEHDDANRALMGSNMQRQAVPLLKAKAPLIGTGIEGVVAKDSGVTLVATRDGIIEDVDASRIVIRSTDNDDKEEVEIHKIVKYQRSNQNTCYNQRPIVKKGEFVKKGQIIADGPATEMGELALGQNVMVAFMSWGGYNFEDSIIVSERVVKEDIYTSIHIEEFEVISRDTKLGKEEITKDIPNVGEEALSNLDESGIVKIGAEVEVGDILVGKITPKGETQLSPEEKLLRAIFGDKAGDVKDSSLRVPPGVEGTVIDAKVFSRRGVEKDYRSQSIEEKEIERLEKDRTDEIEIVSKSIRRRLKDILVGKSVKTTLRDRNSGKILLNTKKDITAENIDEFSIETWRGADIRGSMDLIEKMEAIVENYIRRLEQINKVFDNKMAKLSMGDELAPGVIKMVKVYVAVKRKLSVGDKMAGRHGNKGVLSRVLPVEDMPYFKDGTPVDIILNPLGVPSRMNVGQVLEAHLGWASRELGRQIDEVLKNLQDAGELRKKIKSVYSTKEYNKHFKDMNDDDLIQNAWFLKDGIPMATSVFDGIEEDEIQKNLEKAGLPITGQTILYDGRTGEPFNQPVTVGIMYMLKLHHLVDDKIHARSIGPYSLVTQQPLGGKAQFGGQRLGEMEVWAMEAYGAAYSLQEFLTVKSDDVAGRTRMYERIVKGNNILESGLPESFKVLIKELLSLGLEFQLLEDTEN